MNKHMHPNDHVTDDDYLFRVIDYLLCGCLLILTAMVLAWL